MRSPVVRADRVLVIDRQDEFAAEPFRVEPIWKALGAFGLALTVIGVGQVLLTFYPTAGFGSREWEFGAMAQALAGLPLATVGLGALLASALALDDAGGLSALSVLLLVAALAVVGALVLFWSAVPAALQGAPAQVSGALKQTVARTLLLGVGFFLLYGAMAAYAGYHAGHARQRARHG